MKKCILTGATGFIGSKICRKLLENNFEITIITRKNSNYRNIEDLMYKVNVFEYNNDISRIIKFFKMNNFDLVVHLASLFVQENKPEDTDLLIDSNIKFSTHILEAMKYSKCKKIINTSTSWQHYNNEQYNPSCLYASTKEAFESILRFYKEAYNIDYITLELFDTYGENDNRPKILNLLKQYSLNNTILDMSKGEQILDLLYIDDVVDAYLIATDMILSNNGINKKYSLQSENRISLKNLVELYEKITGNNVIINWGARQYRNREIMIPWDKGEILPNWSPKYTLEEGIKKAFVTNYMEDKND